MIIELSCFGTLKMIILLRSQEKVTKDEGAKQDLMERQDSDSEKVSEGKVFISNWSDKNSM